jgi:hypothetical protein
MGEHAANIWYCQMEGGTSEPAEFNCKERGGIGERAMRVLGKVFLWLVGCTILWLIFLGGSWLWWPRTYYALVNSTLEEDVKVANRPTDCDWTYAPLGEKGCHYEKEVLISEYRSDSLNNVTLTQDGGKTWTQVPDRDFTSLSDRTWNSLTHGQRHQVIQVDVEWNKVND